MSEQTKIAWCDSTDNFWIGCEKISAGCKNCYADAQDERRFSRTLGGGSKENPIHHFGKGAPRYKVAGAVKDALAFNRKPWCCPMGHSRKAAPMTDGKGFCVECDCEQPFHRRRIFSLSLGDWLDSEIPIDWFREMLETILNCGNVTWILCSKRPENFFWRMKLAQRDIPAGSPLWNWIEQWLDGQPPRHVVGLCSAENQPMADSRIPKFMKIPFACYGLSMEPLLGPVDIMHGRADLVDWIIIGGESGSNARPCNVDWIRSLVEQGKAAGVATFCKQLGSKPVCDCSVAVESFSKNCCQHFAYPIRDKKGGDSSEWSPDLRVQQWPKGF